MDMSPEEIARRQAFVAFGPEDAERLRSLADLARRYLGPIIEALYVHLLAFDEAASFFRDPEVLQRVQAAQREYHLGLTRGEYGAG